MADKGPAPPKRGPPVFGAMKKTKVVEASEEQKQVAAPQETYGDAVKSLAVAPMFSKPAAAAAAVSVVGVAPKSAAVAAAELKAKLAPKGTQVAPKVPTDDKKRAIRTINLALAALAESGTNFEDVRGPAGPDGRRSFAVPFAVSKEILKTLDSDYKTLRFTPEGFSGVEGPDFDADIQKLMTSFVDVSKEKDKISSDLSTFSSKLQALGKPILDAEYGSQYLNPAPKAYIPETRRGFSESIETIYRRFILPAHEEKLDFEACAKQGVQGQTKAETYLYQQFIREYMRNESPYRGLLVYHGLGSGKTCSAIAAAEALFANGHKRIVVMTPFSLRKNFINEISFCGFQHFRLQNHWIPLDLKDQTVRLFAKTVYDLPEKYKATSFWVPDFTKAAEPNYKTLDSKAQLEIRAQINAVINDRITFINYNGVSAAKLKEFACAPPTNRIFDNAVIVIDEVHNLIRLMQGTIEPYLANIPTKRRKIMPEPIKTGRWTPGLCGKPKNYKRGYLFYRLLLDATNSKIVALSGTPLINFPDELAILANVLHGYLNIAQGSTAETDPVSINTIEKTAREHLHIDFARVTPTPSGTSILVTPLPYGVKKVFGADGEMSGVIRMGEDQIPPTFEDIMSSFKQALESKTLRVKGEFVLRTEPLLPPFHEQFIDTFIGGGEGEGLIKNKNILAKRLTGLISYYKGSKEELMPLVTRDEVVRVPMSIYQSREYMRLRLVEVKKELKDAQIPAGQLAGKAGAIWKDVYEIAGRVKPGNYRMESRQACSFVFPEEVTRPRPRTQKELQEEDLGRDPVEFIGLDAEQGAVEANVLLPDEAGAVSDAEAAAAAEAEDAAIEAQEEREFVAEPAAVPLAQAKPTIKKIIKKTPVAAGPTEGGALEIDATLDTSLYGMEGGVTPEGEDVDEEEIPPSAAAPSAAPASAAPASAAPSAAAPSAVLAPLPPNAAAAAAVVAAPKPPTQPGEEDEGVRRQRIFAEAEPIDAKLAQGKKITLREAQILRDRDLILCKSPSEDYKEACIQAKICLKKFCAKKLTLTNPAPNNLQNYSAKYAAILERIESSPGSSLVYSQFLSMEGIGIFSIVMELNGYTQIKIEASKDGVRFDAKTAASLKKGAADNKRFIQFTGEEPEEIRRMNLDLFNARFNALPKALTEVLQEGGFTDNKQGQLCRVFCITSAGAKGLSLKNVRRVHIMEPYWNDVRLAQVKGRAVRICSHMDLPYDADPAKNQRTVEVFTYISVYSPEQQVAKDGPLKIDESIANQDSIGVEGAKSNGIVLPQGAEDYIITSDEHLYLVSQSKRAILEELENVMKSAAVDCRLNLYDNGDVQCLQLRGKVGDFMYHPVLEQDILEGTVNLEKSVAGPKAQAETEDILEIELGERKLLAAPVKDDSGKVIRYDLFEALDKARTKVVGTMTADPTTGDPTGEATFSEED